MLFPTIRLRRFLLKTRYAARVESPKNIDGRHSGPDLPKGGSQVPDGENYPDRRRQRFTPARHGDFPTGSSATLVRAHRSP
jgi:hypothetical protein